MSGARFRTGRRDPGEALELLLASAGGHPQRAMLLAHHLYEQTKPASTASTRTLPLQGRAAREEFGISKTGSNQATVSGLERDGHVVADSTTRSGWRVVDPLLEQWLANGRSWPGPES